MKIIKKIFINIIIMLMLVNISFPITYAVANTEEKKETITSNIDSENVTNMEENNTNNTNNSENTNNNNTNNNSNTNSSENTNTNNTNNNNTNSSGNTNNNITFNNIIENETKEEQIIKVEEETVSRRINNSEKTIENGTYEIETLVGTNKLLDVESNDNLYIWDKKNNSKTQKFDIKYNSEGYYTITNINTSKVLDVCGGIAQNGTNVQVHESNGTDAQKWIIKQEKTGIYSIISKGTGLYLDIDGGLNKNGRNVDIYESNGSLAQQFKFKKIEPIKGEKTIENGTYEIETLVGTNKLLDVQSNDNLYIWDKKNNSKTQKFDIKYNAEGYYTITNINTSKVLDVCGGIAQNGTNVQVHESNGTDAQKWIIKQEKTGIYSIISKGTGLYLDIEGGLNKNGRNVDIYESNGSLAQQFKFKKIEPIKGEKTIEDGIYGIKTLVGANKFLEVEDNDNIYIWEKKNNSRSQAFEIKYNEGGYYIIKQLYTSKVLDVCGGISENGTRVQVHTFNGSEAQKWIIKQEISGEYSIISKGTGLYLDIFGGIEKNGTNVDIYESNGSLAQQFEFPKLNPIKDIEEGNYEIQMAIDSKKLIDISEEDSNARIWEKRNVRTQKFYIKEVETGYYTIKELNSKKVLDVTGGLSIPGTNVQAHEYNGSDAQKWRLILNEDGTYCFESKLNNLKLDVGGGQTSNGSNLQVYTSNGSQAQKFSVKEIEVVETAKTIENGTYKIRSKINSNMVLEASKGSNIQLDKDEGRKNQKFEITYIKDEYYKMEVKHSGKVVNVENGKTNDGANVNESEDIETKSQKWIIKKEEGEYYSIIAWDSNLYLDVVGGIAQKGSNVDIYTSNRSNAQRFKLEKTESIQGTKTINDGVYKIQSAINTNKVLDVKDGSVKNGANIQLWDNANVKQQYFNITYVGNGDYEIESLHSEKILDVANSGLTSGTNVQQEASNKTNSQKWIIKDEGNGQYSIISKYNDLYLDVAGAETGNGTNINVYTPNGYESQRFKFSKQETVLEVSDGSYRIRTALSTNMALDIAGGSKENGANVQIWNSTNVLQQKFKLIYNNDGYYTIRVVHSNKVLDVQGGGTAPGTNVHQHDSNNSDAQKWILKNAGEGYYYIISKLNGLYLDVNGANKDNGSNVAVYTGNQTNAQKFAFDEVYFGIDISEHQGIVNFNTLKASGKADFVIARAGYGRNYEQKDQQFERNYEQKDQQFERNYSESKRLNMPIGSYIYSYASDVEGAKAEANNALSWLKGKNFELPVFYDLEDSAQDGVSKEELTNMAIAFCEILKQNGYKVGVYANKNWLINRINVKQLPSDYVVWVAAYGLNNGFIPEEKYEYIGDHDIWQYSSAGKIDGVNGDTDLNVTYRKEAQENYFGTEENKVNEKINYTVNIENIGWTGFAYNGEKLGMINKAKGIKALRLKTKQSLGVTVSYRAYSNNKWSNWVLNANTLESNSSFNGIEIKLNDYSKYNIKYRVYIQAQGWSSWGVNGATVGNINENKKIEAIQILLYDK